MAIKGNCVAYVHIEKQDMYSHFFLCTIWDTWEDIILYAGDEPHIAISYPEDKRFDLISDPIVIHQEVSSCHNPFITK